MTTLYLPSASFSVKMYVQRHTSQSDRRVKEKEIGPSSSVGGGGGLRVDGYEQRGGEW